MKVKFSFGHDVDDFNGALPAVHSGISVLRFELVILVKN